MLQFYHLECNQKVLLYYKSRIAMKTLISLSLRVVHTVRSCCKYLGASLQIYVSNKLMHIHKVKLLEHRVNLSGLVSTYFVLSNLWACVYVCAE